MSRIKMEKGGPGTQLIKIFIIKGRKHNRLLFPESSGGYETALIYDLDYFATRLDLIPPICFFM